MYSRHHLHVPEKYHERIKNAVTQDRPLSIKIDLTKGGDNVVLLTPGQVNKIQKAIFEDKKDLTLKMSRKQVKKNVEVEGGFLSMLLRLATKALPTLLGGLATGLLSAGVEKAVKGNGLYLGRKGYGTAKVDFSDGGGLILTPVETEKHNGLYLKNDNQIFQGKGLLLGANSPFKNIPILGLIL